MNATARHSETYRPFAGGHAADPGGETAWGLDDGAPKGTGPNSVRWLPFGKACEPAWDGSPLYTGRRLVRSEITGAMRDGWNEGLPPARRKRVEMETAVSSIIMRDLEANELPNAPRLIHLTAVRDLPGQRSLEGRRIDQGTRQITVPIGSLLASCSYSAGATGAGRRRPGLVWRVWRVGPTGFPYLEKYIEARTGFRAWTPERATPQERIAALLDEPLKRAFERHRSRTADDGRKHDAAVFASGVAVWERAKKTDSRRRRRTRGSGPRPSGDPAPKA